MSRFREELKAEGSSLWLKIGFVAAIALVAWAQTKGENGANPFTISNLPGYIVVGLLGGFVGGALGMKDLAHRLKSEGKPRPAWLETLYNRHAFSIAIWIIIALFILMLVFALMSFG